MGPVREHPMARPDHEPGVLQRGWGGRVREAPAPHPDALQQPGQRADPALRQHRRLQALPQHGARREGRSALLLAAPPGAGGPGKASVEMGWWCSLRAGGNSSPKSPSLTAGHTASSWEMLLEVQQSSQSSHIVWVPLAIHRDVI